MERVYDEKIELRIQQEFSRLKDECYLEHAGATLYSETQIKSICEDLCGNLYSNPHSLSQSSKNTTDLVDQIRSRILNHFHTNPDEYNVIFTSNATSAVKLLLENFDWELQNNDEQYSNTSMHESAYIYTHSNHTSIVGGREIARINNIPFYCLDYKESFSIFEKDIISKERNYVSNSLFAFPAQCNFSGRKYPLNWVRKTQDGALDSYGLSSASRNSKWFCLLDASTYCSTNDLNFSIVQPDFVCISFYKIFGYPTGLGALIVRNKSSYVLKKNYFGGGTVEISLPRQNFHKLRTVLHERFEDGTIPYLSIIALDHGLKTLKRLTLNMRIISQHVFNLAKYAFEKLKALKHWNGVEAVELYADTDYTNVNDQGGIVNFNLKRSNQSYIGYVEVLHIANLHKIQFRTGCFCNPGACQRHLNLTDDDLKQHYKAGHICGDTKDLINGRPTGSIRISFGYMTEYKHIDKLIDMIRDCFVEVTIPQWALYKDANNIFQDKIYLKRIFTYPVKSCGAMEVTHWKLNRRGLEYDREWMIITDKGICLTQKQEPKLSLIIPKLDLHAGELTLSFKKGGNSVSIPLSNDYSKLSSYDICESKVCGDRIQAFDCGDEVADWLCDKLDRIGLRLVRQVETDDRKSKKNLDNSAMLSLANQAQYLLINEQSVRWLQSRIGPQEDFNSNTLADRFRSNFLIDGSEEFAELNWSQLNIGSTEFRVDGQCTRCQMICIDQHTGEKNRKPLVELSRALNGKLRFGIYLSHKENSDSQFIHTGDRIEIHD